LSDKSLGSARRLGPARRLGFRDFSLSLPLFVKGPGLGLALPAAKLGFYSAILSLPPPAGLARRHHYPTLKLACPRALSGDLSPPLPNWEFNSLREPRPQPGPSQKFFHRRNFWSFAPPMALLSSPHRSATVQCTAVPALFTRSADAVPAWRCSPAAEWKWLIFHRRRWRARRFLAGRFPKEEKAGFGLGHISIQLCLYSAELVVEDGLHSSFGSPNERVFWHTPRPSHWEVDGNLASRN
jgi:hypothetical protein